VPAGYPDPEQPLKAAGPENFAEEKARLALACQLDRLNFRLAMRPTPLERLSLKALEKIAPMLPLIPGSIGKWARRIAQGTNLVRGVYESVFS
jgi:hypothetical protein